MIDIKEAKTIEQQYYYFHKLVAALDQDPQTALQSLIQNKAQIVALILQAKLKSAAKTLDKMELAEIAYFSRKIAVVTQLLQEVASIKDPVVLEAEAQKIKTSVQDPALAKLIDEHVALLLKYPREVKIFQELAVELEALEAEWQTGNPLAAVKKLFYGMRDELPQQLRERYHDKETAKMVETELQKSEYSSPLPNPTQLKTLVLRIATQLEQPQMFAQRFQTTKEEVVKDLQKEMMVLQKNLDKKMRKVREALEEYHHHVENIVGTLNEDAESRLEVSSDLFTLLRVTAQKAALNMNILATLISKQPENVKQKIIQAALQRYRILLLETEKATKALKRLRKVVKTQDALTEDALARA